MSKTLTLAGIVIGGFYREARRQSEYEKKGGGAVLKADTNGCLEGPGNKESLANSSTLFVSTPRRHSVWGDELSYPFVVDVALGSGSQNRT